MGGIIHGKNLALEFVRVTEAAAIACSAWMGKGDKNKADGAAVDAMRERFNYVGFKGTVVIGEGDKDEAPLLFTGWKSSDLVVPEMDIAVDPLECTSNLANGKNDSISVLAAGPKGTLLHAPGTYMEKLIVGPKAKGCINIKASVAENLKNISDALGKPIHDVLVCILDRPRHEQLIKEVRQAGAKIKLIDNGDVGGGIAAALPNSGIDVMWGTGGAPEGVITAAALKCTGGDMQAILRPHNKEFKQQALNMGFTDLDKIFQLDDLAKGNDLMFAATGVTDGPFLRGVVATDWGYLTHSIVMRAKSGTIRYLETHHHESIPGRDENNINNGEKEYD